MQEVAIPRDQLGILFDMTVHLGHPLREAAHSFELLREKRVVHDQGPLRPPIVSTANLVPTRARHTLTSTPELGSPVASAIADAYKAT